MTGIPTGTPAPWRPGGDDPVLAETLRLAVACWMVEMRGLTAEQRRHRLPRDAAGLVGSRGDALQWRGKSGRAVPGTAATFNALAAGMAALAGEDGGVTALGVHACARDHDGCPNTRTTEVAGGRHEP